MCKSQIANVISVFQERGIIPHYIPNGIGLWPNEQECLLWCCINAGRSQNNWLEIGSFHGGTTILMALARYMLGLPPSVVTIDIKFNTRFLSNVGLFNYNYMIRPIECPSDNIPKYYNKPIDLAFIDGFHSFHQVVKDFETVLPLLTKNAIVLFHDVSPAMYAPETENITNVDPTHFSITVEDFFIDEAVYHIMQKHGWEQVVIPVRKPETHFTRTKLTEWVRGKTSPFNALVAIRRKK